jgi:hypothetical protein
MKKVIWSLFLIPAVGWSAPDPCRTSAILAKIRPGAAWTMAGGSIDGLRWLDGTQKKPTVAEVEKAKAACLADANIRDAKKAQARLELKNMNTPVETKVNDLILLLDMDR